jgi:thiol:disulfide interchange protein DsbD
MTKALPRVLLALVTLVLAAPACAAQDEFLDPEVAFKYAARVVDPHHVEVNFRIVDGYYLYRDKFQFSVEPASAKVGEPKFPAGKIKTDEFFGKVETYRGDIKILVPVESARAGMAMPASIKLKTIYQGCADAGICYPPQDRISELKLAGGAGGIDVITGGAASTGSSGLTKDAPQMNSAPAMSIPTAPAMTPEKKTEPRLIAPESEQSRIVTLLRGGNFWTIILGFLGIGVLLAFTPCVFPMIPIISGIIVGEGQRLTRSRSFLLSLSYVLGMAIMYTAAGVAAGLSGTLLSNALQNAWVLGAFALLFVALSLSMFGFYELQLPTALQSKLADTSNRVGGGKMGATFIMGALSAIIVGPCVAAPLAGALLYIGQTRDVLLGGSALFAMALGMGVPLLIVGLSAGALLPRAGAWMDSVKRAFGVMLLGLAIYVASPVLPPAAVMLAVSALLIVSAIYLHAIDPLPPHAKGAHRLFKGIGVIGLVVGVVLLIGVLSGGRDILQPLSGLRAQGMTFDAPAVAATHFERVKSVAELDARLASANRPAMLDFYADWCVSCKEMERYTFSDAQVQAKFSGMLLLQADVTANDDEDKALLKRFNLFGPPGIIFFDGHGKELADSRVVGYQPSEEFLKTLAFVSGS